MQSICLNCHCNYTVFNKDLELLNKFSIQIGGESVSIPPPTHCPDCRAQRRLSWRNERQYFKSKSALTQKPIISVFHPGSSIKACSYDEWWSDLHNPLQHGRDFDFSRPFFEQFHELLLDVPQMSMIGSQNENSVFCHLIANCKNCYLLVESSNCENCYYSFWLQKCLDCVDSSFSHECNYCYEIDNCFNCYNLRHSKDCNNCSDSTFLQSCIGCSNCFGCVNLSHKEFHIYNKPVTKAEYQSFLSKINLGLRSEVDRLEIKFKNFTEKFPKKYAEILKSEDCIGNYIVSSKDCFQCFHAHDAEHCRYGEHVFRNSKYNMDVSTVGRDAELIYESINTGISVYKVMFSVQCWGSSELTYCYCCMNSKQSFACVGLKNNSFCIFNKQYSESEYHQLLSKIVEHMKTTSEWGEFFPASNSIFPYNDTSAQERFPMNEQECLDKALDWRKNEPQEYIPQNFLLPDNIVDIDNNIITKALACIDCGKNYRLMSKEVDFYKKHNLPASPKCPDCRHNKRMNERPGYSLNESSCSLCKQPITTPHKNLSKLNVYCDNCFSLELN